MPAPLPKKEARRRLAAFASTKSKAHPSGSMTLASQKLGNLSPAALSNWLNQKGVKTVNEPLVSKDECIAALKSYIARHKAIPSRDTFIAHSTVGVRWKTHWPIWAEFLQDAGVIGDETKILLLDI